MDEAILRRARTSCTATWSAARSKLALEGELREMFALTPLYFAHVTLNVFGGNGGRRKRLVLTRVTDPEVPALLGLEPVASDPVPRLG